MPLPTAYTVFEARGRRSARPRSTASRRSSRRSCSRSRTGPNSHALAPAHVRTWVRTSSTSGGISIMEAPVRVDGNFGGPKLPRMATSPLSTAQRAAFRLVAVSRRSHSGVGCRNDKPPARIDTSFTACAADASTPPAHRRSNGWDVAAGPVLLVAGRASPTRRLVFFRGRRRCERAAGHRSRGPGHRVRCSGVIAHGSPPRSSCRRATTTRSAGCGRCAICARVARAARGPSGFVSQSVTPIPLDSVDALPARDSMALAAEASGSRRPSRRTPRLNFKGCDSPRTTSDDSRSHQVCRRLPRT